MKGYFYGWYFKCQSDTQTLAIIPAIHGAGRERTCSVQFITDDNVYMVTFSGEIFCRKGDSIIIGKNRFGKQGIQLEICEPDLCIRGKINFGELQPIKYDIMGPFVLVPFMECRHSVWSMRHHIKGKVYINGKKFDFDKGVGYWEGDRGRSFPKEYAWTQCIFPGGSLMLSVADIPLAGVHFTGIIGVVLYKGKEYRLATYLGAKVVKKGNGRLWIVQGKLELEARLLEKTKQPLKAPDGGNMIRTIHESATCRAYYRFRIKGQTVFAFETESASFEYEY